MLYNYEPLLTNDDKKVIEFVEKNISLIDFVVIFFIDKK